MTGLQGGREGASKAVVEGTNDKNNYFIEMCSGSEEGSYLRLVDFSITQL